MDLHVHTARHEGRQAAARGAGIKNCPYQVGTHERSQWLIGYSDPVVKPIVSPSTDGEILALAEQHGLVWTGRGTAHSEAPKGHDIKNEILAFARDLMGGRVVA
jgi:ribosome modulation factor